MDTKSEFILGLDLGQAQDYTALAIVERIPTSRKVEVDNGPFVDIEEQPGPDLLHCRHLQRFSLGTSYPAIIEQVAALLRRPELHEPILVVDQTGVGRAVVDSLRAANLYPIAVTIVAGDSESQVSYSDWRVPKRNLVGVLQVAMQEGRLKFAADLPEVPTLVQELLNFKVKITQAANDTYGAWREGIHDDLVLALSMAVWHAENRAKTWWIT